MAETQDIIGILNRIIQRYSPGGEFGKGEEALLGRAKTKAMASSQQQLVSAGLAGTTVGAGRGQRWEEEIGMPERLRLEDVRSQRLSEAMGAKAGYLERTETRAEQTRLAEQQMTQQQEQAEWGALSRAHAAKVTGGGRGAVDRGFWADTPTTTVAGAGGPTQHVGEAESWFMPTGLGAGGGLQAGLKVTAGTPGAMPESAFGAPTKKPTAQRPPSLAQTAEKWITPSETFMSPWM